MFSGRRLLPPTIAVVLIAVVSVVIWLANRSAPIPTKPPASAPAVGSCWNVDGAAIGGQMPWPGAPLACTAPHTAEVSAVGQVDAKLVRNAQRAKGQNAEVNSFLMTAAARARCSDKTGIYVGAAWRGAQLTVYPDFIAPAKNGFFACVVAQVADPGGTRLVTRTASLAGALNGSGATSLSIDCVAPTIASGAGSSTSADDQLEFVDCGKPHTAEFIALYTVTPAGAPYNGPAIKNAVTSGCQQLVDSFIGLSPGQQRTDLRVSEVGPDSANLWAGSDQSFACYASAQTPWTGSLKGLGTRPLPH